MFLCIQTHSLDVDTRSLSAVCKIIVTCFEALKHFVCSVKCARSEIVDAKICVQRYDKTRDIARQDDLLFVVNNATVKRN